MHRDANVSSSISFESLNFAVIFPHWYGKTPENSQVTAYFTETSGIAECKRPKFYIFNFFSQRKMLTFILIVLWWYMCSIAQKVNYAIDKCKLYIYELFNYSSGYNERNHNFCVENCFIYMIYDIWNLNGKKFNLVHYIF